MTDTKTPYRPSELLMELKIQNRKTLLFPLFFSLLIHGILLIGILNLPAPKVERKAPLMVDLRELPLEKKLLREKKPAVEQPAPVQPRAGANSPPQPPVAVARPLLPRPFTGSGNLPKNNAPLRPEPVPASPRNSAQTAPAPVTKPAPPAPSTQSPGEELFRPKAPKRVEMARLFPSAEKAAKIEDTYRRKYADEVTEGEASFLDKDDILFGSFLSRFENAVYGVWRYPQEAKALGLQGVTPVRITFNKRGEVENVALLESSGSTILDQEVLRTLHTIGPLGPLPRSYDKSTFKLVAFFHYRFVRGAVSGVIR